MYVIRGSSGCGLDNLGRLHAGISFRTLMRVFISNLTLVGLFLLTACGSLQPARPDLPLIQVHTEFTIYNLCDVGVSPEIHLADVPPGTAAYTVQITNTNVLFQSPWRETVPATSMADIPEGAAKTYAGPCFGDMIRFNPPAPRGYTHRVEILARDSAGRPLGYGSTVVYVQSAYLTARRQRQGGGANVPSLVPASPEAAPPSVFPPSMPSILGPYQ